MSLTITGVKITLDFLRRDKKNIKKLTRLSKLMREGKLTERGKQALARCIHKHEYRYGTAWRTRTPEENAKIDEEMKKSRETIREARKMWDDLDEKLKQINDMTDKN